MDKARMDCEKEERKEEGVKSGNHKEDRESESEESRRSTLNHES